MRVARGVALLVASAGAFAAGCGTADSDLVPDPFASAAGVVRVEVLGRSFVRVGQERMPDDEFLFRMRQRLREAGDNEDEKPGVQIVAGTEGADRAAAFADRVLVDLGRAGLVRLELGDS